MIILFCNPEPKTIINQASGILKSICDYFILKITYKTPENQNIKKNAIK